MAKVSVVVLPSLAETIGIEVASKEVISGRKIEGSSSVRDILNRLSTRYYRFEKMVFDINAQKLTGRVIIFLNDRALVQVNGLETILHDGDTLTFVPFIEGG